MINDHGFVDLIGAIDGRIEISKNPVIYKGNRSFEFHLANGNPLVEIIKNSGHLEMLISGPHEYISPKWYKSSPAVPTWNYVAVQISLICHIVTDIDWMIAHHSDLLNKYDKYGWTNILPDKFRSKLNSMITGVSAKVVNFEAKYKLGQNRSDDDFTGIYYNLTHSDNNNELARIMIRDYSNKIKLSQQDDAPEPASPDR